MEIYGLNKKIQNSPVKGILVNYIGLARCLVIKLSEVKNKKRNLRSVRENLYKGRK